MTVLTILEFLRNHSSALKRCFFVLLAVLVLMDVLLPRDHPHYFVDKIQAYWTLFAVIGCFALIKVSKGIAHLFLSKDEDYYG